MLDTVKDQYENLRDQIGDRIDWGEPDGRNAGIGITE